MPSKPMRPCATPGCPAIVQSGKCAKCQGKGKGTTTDGRLSACKRGYGRDWQKFQAWFIRRNPLCHDCLEQGQPTPTTEVHHIVKVATRYDLRLVESNCLALCKSCHSKRTARGE